MTLTKQFISNDKCECGALLIPAQYYPGWVECSRPCSTYIKTDPRIIRQLENTPNPKKCFKCKKKFSKKDNPLIFVYDSGKKSFHPKCYPNGEKIVKEISSL
jgi:hypothetical protein